MSSHSTKDGQTENIAGKVDQAYSAVVASAVDGCGLVDDQGRLIEVNEKYSVMLGRKQDELRGRPLGAWDSPDAAKAAMQELRAAVNAGGGRFELKQAHANGSMLEVEVSVAPLAGTGLALCYFRDLTSNRREQLELRINEERLRLALQAANQGLYDLDLKAGVAHTTQEYMSILGYEAGISTLDLAAWSRMLHPEDAPHVQAVLQECITGSRQEYSLEYRMRAKDGSWRCLLSTGKVVAWDEDGRPARMVGTHIDATDRMRAYYALRESEERHRGLIAQMDQGVIYADPQRTITSMNDAARRILGLQTGQSLKITPSTDWRVVREDFTELPLEEHPIERALLTGRPTEQMVLGVQQPGSAEYTWIAISAVPRFRQGQAGPHEVAITFSDITVLKQSQYAVQEREEQYRSTIDNLADPMHVVDRELRIVLINQVMHKWLEQQGVDPDILGRTLSEAFPFLPERVMQDYMQVFSRGEPLLTEDHTVIQGKDVYTEVRRIPVTRDGRVVQIVTILRDISERIQQEQVLRQALFSLEQASAAVYWINDKARIFYVNQAACNCLGYTREELQSMTILDIDPNLTWELWQLTREKTKQFRSRKIESFHRRKDGSTFPVEIYTSFAEFEGFEYTVSFAHDITERKHGEAALRLATFSLEHASESVFWVAEDSRIVYANETALSTLGFEKEELVGRSILTLDPTFDATRWTAIWEQLRQSKVVKYETAHQRKDGSLVPVEIVANFAEFEDREYIFAFIRDISERRQAQQALQDSERLLRESQVVARIGSFAQDNILGIISTSPMFDEIFGIDEHYSKTPQGWLELIHPAELQQVIADLHAAEQGCGKFDRVTKIIRVSDRAERLVRVVGQFEYGPQGKVTRLLGTAQDVTGQLEAEHTLSVNEERLRLALRAARQGLIDLDLRTMSSTVTPEYAEILGYSAEEFSDSWDFWCTRLHPDDFAGATAALAGFISGELQDYDIEYRQRRKDGAFIWVHSIGLIVDWDDQGRPSRLIGTIQDITERKEAEETLMRSEERLRSIFDSAPYGVHMYELQDGQRLVFSSYNQAADQLLHIDHRRFLGKTIEDAFPPLVGTPIPEAYRRIAADGGYYRDDQVIYSGDVIAGAFELYAFQTAPHRMAVFFHDITERKRAEEALKESEERWQFALEGAGDGVWDWRVQEAKVYYSARWKAMLGYAESEITDDLSEWESRVHPDDLKQAVSDLERCTSGTTPLYENEHRMRCKDGSYKWILDRGKVVERSADGLALRMIGTHTDITARKHAEAALASLNEQLTAVNEELASTNEELSASNDELMQSQQAINEIRARLEATLASVPEILMEVDTNKVYTWANAAGLEFFGADVIGREAADYFAGEQETYTVVQPMFDGAEDVQFVESWQRRKDGELRLLAWRCRALKTPAGEVVGALSTASDITERKRVEDALRESEQSLRAILDTSPLGISVRSRTGQLLDYNPAWQRIWNIPDDAIAKDMSQPRMRMLFDKRDAYLQPWYSDVSRIYEQGGTLFIPEMRTVNPRPGAAAWISQHFYAITEPSGVVDRVVIITQDISERKQAEERMRLLAAAIEQTTEVVMVADAQGRMVFANPAFELVTGYQREDVLGSDPSSLPGGQHNWFNAARELTATGGSWRGRISAKRADGTQYQADLTVSPVVDADNVLTNFSAVMRDVTQLAEMEAQLRQAQKLEAIGTLAGGIAHDFNNMLFAILGNAELALDELPADSPLVPNIQDIVTASVRAKALVQQILVFSRHTEPAVVPFSLPIVAKEVVKLIRATIPSTIEIKLKLMPMRALVMVDPTEIHQVLMNLCTNAVHAMEHGSGTLTITMRERILDAKQAAAYMGLRPGLHVEFTVSDTGVGIEPVILERIFEPFFTTKSQGKGTGMGLAVVHGIVTRLGGAVTVLSKPGEGATFSVLLPAMPGGEFDTAAEPEPMQHGRENVLLVDDEPVLLEMLARMLKSLGYEVTCCANGAQALECFLAAPQQYDIVITDQTMPHMTGAELAHALLEHQPGIPVILCTGYSERFPPDIAADLGIRLYLHKPVTRRDLAEAIRSALDTETS